MIIEVKFHAESDFPDRKFHLRTPHTMNGKVLSVELSETSGFGTSKRVE